MEGDDVAHFKNVIRYMYTGETSFITEENVLALIGMTNYYGVLSLKEVCGDLLCDQVHQFESFRFDLSFQIIDFRG